MTDSIARRVLTAAILLATPLVLLIFLFVADMRARVAALLLVLIAVGLAWWLAESLARRMRALTAFVDSLLEPATRPTPAPDADDLGDLTRAVSRLNVRIAGMVGRLTTDLTRREAVLASMTEAVLAVDGQLNITF